MSHRLRSIFHNELAISLYFLGRAERRTDYTDRAILEYTAAVYHVEQAGHEQYGVSIENNLAFLLYKLGRYREAYEHLDRAQAVLTRIKKYYQEGMSADCASACWVKPLTPIRAATPASRPT